MSANLYKAVDREKRILYEEREADGILLIPDGSVVEEGGTVNVAVQLRKPSTEDVVINLVGSGTATYGEIGDNGDWLLNNGSGNCSAVTGTSCQITITAGETTASDNVVITINGDGGDEGAENIVLSTTIASGDASLTSRPLVLTIPVDPPLPTVSLSADSTSIREGGTATITLTLSEALGSDATFNLIGGGGAEYGASADWNLSVGGTDCSMASESNPCQVTISQRQTTAEVTVGINADLTYESSSEAFTVSVAVDSGSLTIVQPGSNSSLNFTVLADPSVSATTNIPSSVTSIVEGGFSQMDIILSQALTEDVTFNLAISGGNATYGTTSSDDWYVSKGGGIGGGVNCDSLGGTNCQVTITAGNTMLFGSSIDINVNTDTATETLENFTIVVSVASGSEHLVRMESPASVTFTIPAN